MQAAAGSQDGVQHTTMALGLSLLFGFLLIVLDVTVPDMKGKAVS